MSIDDDAKVQAIKGWWQEYGKFVLTVVAVIVVAFYGFRFIQQQKLKVASSASVIYNDYQEALYGGDFPTLEASYAALMDDYAKTPYASAVSLIEAARDANTGNLEGAREKLEWILAKGDDYAKPIAQLRIAEILVQEQQYDGALAMLQDVSDTSPYKPAYDELKGDILVMQGDIAQALQVYQLALQEYRAQGMDNVLLQFKLQTYAPGVE